MLKAIIFCLTIGISPKSFSQGFINSSKTVVKKYLNDYIVKQHVKSVTTETDTSIMFLVRDASIQNLDLKIYFDKNGKCIKEERKLTCDSCLNKILDETLNSKEYNWTKISNTEYVSKFSKKLLLKKNTGIDYSFTIQTFSMNRKEYKDLLRQLK